MAKVRIKLKSMKIEQLNKICSEIKEIASKSGIPISGPIPLPTKKMKITTRKIITPKNIIPLFIIIQIQPQPF